MKKQSSALPKRAVMEIVSVKVPNRPTKSSQPARGFLEEKGFVIVDPSTADDRIDGYRDENNIYAASPCGDVAFYVEYAPKGSPLFRIVRLRLGRPSDVDTGTIQGILPPASDKTMKFFAMGREEIGDWEFVARPTSLKQIPERKLSDAGESMMSAAFNGKAVALPTHTESGLPSTAAAMARLALEHREEMAEDSDLRKPEESAVIMPKISAPKKKKSEVWPYEPAFWKLGKSVSAISNALYVLLEQAETKASLARQFDSSQPTVMLLLNVRKLHPRLKLLLDKTRDDPERISPQALKQLVLLPLDEQVAVWNMAKKQAGTSSDITAKIMESVWSRPRGVASR